MRKTTVTCKLYTSYDKARRDYSRSLLLNTEDAHLYSVLWKCEKVSQDVFCSISHDIILSLYALGKKVLPEWWIHEFLVNSLPSYPENDLVVYFYAPEFSLEELECFKANNVQYTIDTLS